MVTDQEYKALLDKVNALEKKVDSLAEKYVLQYMKSGNGQGSKKPNETKPRLKDISGYIFEGNMYCKRNLVLACVKKYIIDNKVSCSEVLRNIFPDYLQGSLGVVRKVEDAERYSNATSRFFFKDNEVISLDDGNYVVCKQWDIKNISKFIKCAENLGYIIEVENKRYR